MSLVSIVAGPMVRYVDETNASVWIELDVAATVVARATPEKSARDRKRRKLKASDSAITHTVNVAGRHYALLRFDSLNPGTVYAYEIDAAPDARRSLRSTSSVRKSKKRVAFDLTPVSFDGKAPAFRTLPARGKESLRVTFGSCRCFDGGYRTYEGVDVFARYGQHLYEQEFGNRKTTWPHVLLLLGDQIYADDVAPAAVKKIEAFRRKSKKSVFSDLRNTLCPNWDDLDEYVEHGWISSERAGTGEFRCREVAEYAILYEEAWRDADVRLLFANLPTYMLPDDHEVANGWDITAGWREQVLNDPTDDTWLGAVRDGLLAYWLYQGWGNLSPKAAAAHPLVSAIEAAGTEDAVMDLRDLVEQHLFGAIHAPVYYTIPTTPPIVAIDTRSDREFVAPVQDTLDNGTVVVSHVHPDDMILSAKQFEWLEAELAKSATPVIAASLPLFQTRIGDRLLTLTRTLPSKWIEGLETQRQVDKAIEFRTREHDAETWYAFPKSVAKLLDLFSSRKAVFYLSGDVHYSCLYDVQGYSIPEHGIEAKTRLVQAISSPLRYPLFSARTDGVRKLGGPTPKEWDEHSKGWVETHMTGDKEHALREPFGLPKDVFADAAFERMYIADNTIATLEVADEDGFVVSWFMAAEDRLKSALTGETPYKSSSL